MIAVQQKQLVRFPHITQTPSGPVAFIHLQIAKHEIQQAMGPAIREVYAAVTAQNKEITGSWFTVHHSMTADGWDFDACVPISTPITPVGRVSHKIMEPAKAATASYFGGYEGLMNAWPALRDWMQQQNIQRHTWLCEAYVVGPESGLPPAQWKTQLYQPIA
jgi:effector-binding domain-containing protein